MCKTPPARGSDEKVCTGRDLAAALQAAKLSDDEARAWNQDLQKAREALKPLEDERA